MPWTPPRTWTPGETVTAAMMNSHVRDNLNALATRAFAIQIGAAGNGEITAGTKLYFEIPFAMEITGWTLVADQVGSIVLDIWKDTYANVPPTNADSIAGSELPTLASEQKAQDLTLTSWDGEVDAGDVIGVNVDSASDVEVVTLTLRGEPR